MIGISLALYGVGIAVVQGFVIRLKLISSLGDRYVVTLSLLLGSFALSCFGFVSHGWLVFCLIPFAALSELLTPTLGGFLANRVGDDTQGEFQGVLASLSAVTSIISPLLMTGLFKIGNSNSYSFYLPGLPFVFAGLLLISTIIPLSFAMKSKSLGFIQDKKLHK